MTRKKIRSEHSVWACAFHSILLSTRCLDDAQRVSGSQISKMCKTWQGNGGQFQVLGPQNRGVWSPHRKGV
jgi:hypothetical protein